MSVLVLTGCGSKPASTPSQPSDAPISAGSSASADVSSFKTIGDIYAAGADEKERGNTEKDFFIVFDLNGTIYRAYADLTKDIFDQLMALEFDDPEYEQKYQTISGELPIRQLDNLTDMIPPQAELDKWVGKTGKDLQDDGWTEGYGYNLEDMTFYLYKGPFCYAVTFEADKKYENTDDFDVWATISPLTIKSVKYEGIGNGSELS